MYKKHFQFIFNVCVIVPLFPCHSNDAAPVYMQDDRAGRHSRNPGQVKFLLLTSASATVAQDAKNKITMFSTFPNVVWECKE